MHEVRHRKTHHRPDHISSSNKNNYSLLPNDAHSANPPSPLQSPSHKHSQRPSWQTHIVLVIHQLCSFPRSRRKSLIIPLLVATIIILMPIKNVLVGHKKIHGGVLGRLVDSLLRTHSFRRTMAQQNQKLNEHGLYLPPLVEPNVNKKGIPVVIHSYLAEALLRATERQRRHTEAERWNKCKDGGVPPWVLQPNVGKWFRPLYNGNGNVGDNEENNILEFEASEMRDFMVAHFPSLPTNDILMWGLCAVYWYGGTFVTHQVQDLRSVSSILAAGATRVGDGDQSSSCMDKAVLHFEGNDHLRVLKATPRHPLLKCAIQKLQNIEIHGKVNLSLFVDGLTFDEESMWFKSNCQRDDNGVMECCDVTKTDRGKGTLNIQVTENPHHMISAHQEGGPRVDVLVMEKSHPTSGPKAPKEHLADQLAGLGCDAGWFCNRCLKTQWFGTYQACSAVCPPCYEKTICHTPRVTPRSNVTIDVIVQERRTLVSNYNNNNNNNNNNSIEEKRIPRIIHQTYFEELTPDRYPHLYRLQNSWRASGWDYRFYTDEVAREYIIANFPSRFLDAFDALIPGAFKADLFRMLVLLKDGGIYADVDVKLDINLDSFITPNLGFFAPRDIVAGYADGNYCLWNGLVGAAPGHLFVASATERILNLVLNRDDYYDMEREACRYSSDSGATEIWKVRALEILLLTGPCGLGVSVNSALEKQSSVAKFDTGWLRTSSLEAEIGDVLILVVDKYDMGEMRFTDIERNILVASTDQTLLSKNPFETFASNLDRLNHHHAKSHYSTMEHSSDIFGAAGIYTDNLVTNENYKLRIVRGK